MLKYISPNAANQTDQNKPEQQAKTGNGFFMVEVLDSKRHPLSLATVMIYTEYGSDIEIQKVLLTGINGKTEKICVNGKDKEISLCASLHSAPFLNFTIRVDFKEYYTNVHKNVQIPSDRTTVLTSVMTPLPFGARNAPEFEKIFDTSKPLDV